MNMEPDVGTWSLLTEPGTTQDPLCQVKKVMCVFVCVSRFLVLYEARKKTGGSLMICNGSLIEKKAHPVFCRTQCRFPVFAKLVCRRGNRSHLKINY